ncbi:MAG: response regulator [Thiovulaceae bacterium]|nr:response regulator [Sulfurimonadaceae bacterium]
MNTLENLSLLYVEDDPYVQKELALFLSLQVGELHVASNGEEGLELFREHHPDFVLSDIQMPKMDGLSMSKIIKEESPKTPILLITAYSDSEYMTEAIKLKIDGYITKPIQFQSFQNDLSRIATLINQEKALAKKDKLLYEYQKVIDNSAYVTKMDKEGRILYANREFCELTGYTQEELMGSFQKELEYSKEGNFQCETLFKELLEHQIWRGTITILPKKGELLYFETTMVPIVDEEGNIVEIIAYRHNITELETYKQNLEQKVEEEVRKRQQHEGLLIKQTKMAEIGEMLGVITHQWKQPLNNLNMALYNFNKGFKDQEKQKETMTFATDNIMFLSQTIDDFKNFFKPDKDKSEFGIKATISDVERILKQQIRMFNIVYDNSIDDSLKAYGFPNEFKQVFLNLIINAKDAISSNGQKREGGKIMVSSSKEAKHNRITISDTGGGIPKDIITHIFDPYYTTKGDKGSGIGLYISKTIIEDHMQGTLEVQNIDQGSQFTITLPVT